MTFQPLGRQHDIPRIHSEEGSIPLAMLASIVAGGLVVVVMAVTLAGEGSVRFDQEFTGALHAAEAGVEEAQQLFNTRQLTAHDSPVDDPVTGEVGGVPYEWTAELDGEVQEWGPDVWTVTSTGGDEVTRTIEATVHDDPVFDSAAFTDRQLAFVGGNHADSYDSTGEVGWCEPLLGRVGSNETLDFGGKAPANATCEDVRDGNRTVDGVDFLNWEDGEDDPAERCQHNTGVPNNCWESDDEFWPQTHEDDLDFDDDVEWMEELLDGEGDGDEACQANLGTMRTSDDTLEAVVEPGVLQPTTDPKWAVIDQERDARAYCVDHLIFDGDTTLQGASVDEPVMFLVRGSVKTAASHTNVNCEGCVNAGNFRPDQQGLLPDAAALQIFSPSMEVEEGDGVVVELRNQSNFAGAVYAPRAHCTGGASVHVFGSLVCEEIENNGGWQFHYDVALLDAIRTFEFDVTSWSEQ